MSHEKSKIVLQQIAKSEGFEDYDLQINTGSCKGENYLGVIKSVDIKEKIKKKQLNLILKQASNNEYFRKNEPVHLAYDREIYIYTKIFEEFDKFQLKQCGRIIFTGKAKCYGSCLDEHNECLILENLRTKGYKLWERSKPMDAEHVEMVFKEYAKLHGVCMALRTINPNLYKELTKPINGNIFVLKNSKENLQLAIKRVIQRGFKSVASSPKASVAFGRFAKSINELFGQVTKDPKHQVIIHGDCWCNNMLFKYEDENSSKPSNVCLVDFQLSEAGIPVQDLSYFLYICCDKEILYQHKKFLKIYHETLSQVLEELGCDPYSVFTYEDLELQWKTGSKYGLYMTAVVLKVVLSEVDESPDIEKLAENGIQLDEALAIESIHDAEYDKRLIDILIFMDEHNYI